MAEIWVQKNPLEAGLCLLDAVIHYRITILNLPQNEIKLSNAEPCIHESCQKKRLYVRFFKAQLDGWIRW